MNIETASTAGFCFGVRNAIRKAVTAAEESGSSVYTYGPLIHNPQAIGELERKGVFALETMEDIKNRVPEGATVIIRAHGIGRTEEETLRSLPVRILDGTCPNVKKIHHLVEQASADKTVVILGDPAHPEVRGICGWCRQQPLVYPDLASLQADPPRQPAIFTVAQTTFHRFRYEEMIAWLRRQGYQVEEQATICESTLKHQEEAVRLAASVDLMVVIGGKQSSNTRKLGELCRSVNARTLLVESEEELPESCLRGVQSVGITAGASTPDYVIRAVEDKIRKVTE